MFDHRREFYDTTVGRLELQGLRHFETDPTVQSPARMGRIEVHRDVFLARNLKNTLHQLFTDSFALMRWLYADKLNICGGRYL